MPTSESRIATDIAEMRKDAADLHWLAFLLTGQRDLSIEIGADTLASHNGRAQFFTSWMRAWARRIVIAKALAAVRAELSESARRTRLARVKTSEAAPRDWSLGPGTTKTQIEDALLAIDIFPRIAVILSFFEGVQVPDLAVLLDADVDLVRKAQRIGLQELVRNLAGRKKEVASGRVLPLRLALRPQS